MPRVERIRLTGTYTNSEAAKASLKHAGDAALVTRGVPRLLLLHCPCGCGDTLILNLDRRAGAAWRLYRRNSALTVYPSYWRDTHCESHFILWDNRVIWCDWRDYDGFWMRSSDLEARVQNMLSSHYVTYEWLADQLQEIPWDILRVCDTLVRKRFAEAHPDRTTGQYRRGRHAADKGPP